MRSPTLVLLQTAHDLLRRHLFPGDGFEAAAILICGRAGLEKSRLCVRHVLHVPHAECRIRTHDRLSWPGAWIEKAVDLAEDTEDSIILIHSHPGGFYGFSEADDQSDIATIPALYQAVPWASHGSAVMTPDGAVCARIYGNAGNPPGRIRTTLIGNNIRGLSQTGLKPALAFSAAMRTELGQQTACVVGVSGTGSIVAEMLARLGIGRLILIDFDVVEKKNLNRILNSTLSDAELKTAKVSMMANAVRRYRESVDVVEIVQPINDPTAIRAASSADILFSCVDSAEGRLYCDLISQAALIPLIDVGVTIPTRRDRHGNLHIADVCGRIDYVAPGGPSLQDRLVVTPDALRREYLVRNAPEEAEVQLQEGYLKGTREEAPSVISLNMRAASAAVNEWLARKFEIRLDGNAPYSRTLFSLAAMEEDHFPEAAFECTPKPLLGRGLAMPLLGMPAYAE